MDDLIKSLDNLCAAIEHLAEATTESKQEQAPTAAAIKKGVSGQLLEVMARAANAANDSDDRSKLGQWVFEGCDAKWQSAAVDAGGRAYRHNFPADLLHAENSLMRWESDCFGHDVEPISGRFDATDWQNSVIQRQPVNDIDYLTDNDRDHDIAPDVIDSAIKFVISDSDLQRIFIQNLADALIQRMHSMDRFSDDNYHIGGDKLLAWDIVYDKSARRFGLITALKQNHIAIILFQPDVTYGNIILSHVVHQDSLIAKCTRLITEAELPAFRAELEACYAN